VLPVLQDAVERDRKLTFDYTRADGNKSSRTVDPLGLVAKGMSWYMVARGATGLRTYRVSRVEGATVLAVGFERPANFDLAEYWKRSTAELEQKRWGYRTLLSLTAEAARGWPGWFGSAPVQTVGDTGDCGIYEVEFDTEQEARFVVLGLGSQVQVVKPEDLRLWVQAEAQRIALRSEPNAKENKRQL
jgi:predicted DNA-binding transcriptional regulator YafY